MTTDPGDTRTGGDPSIAVVGPCASGKSTLAEALRARGYDARQIVQEHSYVPDMWQQITSPDVLIYLDASFETSTRRKSLAWQRADYEEEVRRLTHAREHCDLYLATDALSPAEVLEAVLEHISKKAQT